MFAINSCRKTPDHFTFKLRDDWEFRKSDNTTWMQANIPGTVHTDLMENGKIEPPFFRLNEHNLQWIDKEDWEYKTSFEADERMLTKEIAELVFKGLDTYAEVYLNDSLVLQADNMFREWVVDCKSKIREGKNTLRIVFRSPIKIGLQKYNAIDYVIPVSDNDRSQVGGLEDKKVSVFTRKAGYHYGWDWGPRFVTCGIWREAYIRAWNYLRIEDVHYVQNQVSAQKADMTAVFEVHSTREQDITFEVKHANNEQSIAEKTVTLQQGKNRVSIDFVIDKPRLWWSNGLGEPYLYTFKGMAKIGSYTVDETETRIGVRKLKVVTKNGQKGRHFYFKLNDVPVFMKGANYIPSDNFIPRVPDEKYEHIIKSAAEANMNMLRVWGGGIYENDIFYDLCDKYGILVWQDFMFACAMYPGDEVFLNNVRHEAVDNVKRLRNHPSLALWCGNNEVLSAWYQWGWKEQAEDISEELAEKLWNTYFEIFSTILPGVVHEHDSTRFYWESSPQAAPNVPATTEALSGDLHYWGVWHGEEDFKSFNEVIPRFMSEYGFQSFPSFETVKRYTDPGDRDIGSEVMQSHQKHPRGNQLIRKYMSRHYRIPDDFEDFLYVSQLLQAEGIKTGMEAHRGNKPACMGSLFWQLNDCWPVASWSGIDYYGRWKALHYFAGKAYDEVLVSPVSDNDNLKIYVVSDRLHDITAKLKLQLMEFDGDIKKEETLQIHIPANSSDIYYQSLLNDFLRGVYRGNVVLHTEIIEDERILSSNKLYFLPVKYLSLRDPEIKAQVWSVDEGYEIQLSSDILSKNVFLSLNSVEGFFTDNYFDLLPGEIKTVRFITKNTEVDIKNELKIKTLNDL